MHVVHVCRSGWPALGGLESAVHGLARALVVRGHRASVVTLSRDGQGQRLHEATHEGVRYVRRPALGPRRYPFARGLRQATREADVIHVHGIDGLADQLAWGPAGPPVGLSTHGGYFHTDWAHGLKRRWWRLVTRRTLRRLGAVWFTSTADAVRLGAGVVGDVVPNGIDAARFAGDRAPRSDRWVVLGRVVPHKGLGDLFEALRHQVDPVPELDVIGPLADADRTDWQKRAAPVPTRVRFWGARPRSFVRERLASAAWAVFPSRYEGFGMAALEAMAAGVPTVVADVPALREAVVPDETGLRADFSDPRAAARVLDRARRTDGQAIAAAGQRAARAADWTVRVDGFLAAYARLRGFV